MDKELQKQQQTKLETEKNKITKDLKVFAKKDPKIKGNWLTRFPFFRNTHSHKDESAEEIEGYENLLPVEHTLELRLQDIDIALEKIKKGKGYGKCEKCNKNINPKRLEIVPEARVCMKCGK
ncbi:MAG: TraR/DksA C4-type zinc finger protein [bacterium]